MIPEWGISHGLRWKWRKTGKLLEWLAKDLLQLWSPGCYQWEDFLVDSKQCTLPVPNRMVPAASGRSCCSCSIHSRLLGQNPDIQAICKKTACQSHLFQNWLLWGMGGIWCSPQCTDALTACLQSLGAQSICNLGKLLWSRLWARDWQVLLGQLERPSLSMAGHPKF